MFTVITLYSVDGEILPKLSSLRHYFILGMTSVESLHVVVFVLFDTLLCLSKFAVFEEILSSLKLTDFIESKLGLIIHLTNR